MAMRSSLPALLLSAAALLAAGCNPETSTQTNTAPAAIAADPAAPVATLANFTLPDQAGQPHELYAMKDAAAVVLVMQGVGCPIVQKMTPGLKAVVADYAPKNVQFLMVNSNIQDSPEMIAKELEKFDLKLPVLKDADQKLGRALNAERTAEVFVIDPKSWAIVYHGPLDDQLTYGAAKAAAENHYVRDVLDAVLAGEKVPAIKQPADGCLINFI